MVVVGADVHKRTHTFVAVDEVGKKLGQVTVRADGKGHDKAVRWAQEQFGADLCWGIEDCRHLSARLELDLLDAGQAVVRVPPKLMAQTRSSARTRGKSDPIDALAVARAVLREPDLPVASHDEDSRELKLLVDRRDDLVEQRTGDVNRLRWHLHRIDPTIDPAPKSLDRAKTRRWLVGLLEPLTGVDARLARELLVDIDRVTTVINALEKEITTLVAVQAPALLELPGCGALTAAKIVGETAGIDRPVRPRGQVRHARRRRPDPGLVRSHPRPGPDVQDWQPPAQHGPAPDRGHPDPARRPRRGLLPQTARHRRLKDRGHPLPEETTRTRRVQHTQERPVNRVRDLPPDRGLT